MTEIKREKILDMIERLMRLSQSDNPNEAAMATAKVAELLQKYNLKEEEVRPFSEKPQVIIDILTWESGVIFSWELDLAHTICNNFMSTYVYNNPWRGHNKTCSMKFVGRRVNAETSKKMYWELRQNFRTSASLAWARLDYWEKKVGDDRSFRNAWIKGAIQGVTHALELQKRQINSRTIDLLVIRNQEVNTFVKEKMNVHNERREQYGNWDSTARNDGYQHGLSVLTKKLSG